MRAISEGRKNRNSRGSTSYDVLGNCLLVSLIYFQSFPRNFQPLLQYCSPAQFLLVSLEYFQSFPCNLQPLLQYCLPAQFLLFSVTSRAASRGFRFSLFAFGFPRCDRAHHKFIFVMVTLALTSSPILSCSLEIMSNNSIVY